MICRYCKLIHSRDKSYPVKNATRDIKGDFPRCEWHWRYICDICGIPRHFNGITWCEKTKKFICIKCGEGNRLIVGRFWAWDTYYLVTCPYCKKRHPTLDKLESEGNHPWQLNHELYKKRIGLSSEREITPLLTMDFLSEDSVISDELIADAWNKIADKWFERYTEYGDINRQYIIDPVIFKLIGSVDGKRVLDAGCGNGYLSRLLSKKGAKVVGIDISRRSIEIARAIENEAPLGIKYHVGSLSNLSFLEDESFDIIISNIVLPGLQDIDNAIKEMYRILKPKGKLVISLLHPCFSTSRIRGWIRKPIDSDKPEDWMYWKVDYYFDRTIEEWKYFGLAPIYSFHRPLSDYINLLIKTGFIITEFEEPLPDRRDVEEHYRELAGYLRIPYFLVIGSIKPK
jgi:ubiquinone/menaquinone biosynthesis C-methylase UbiE